MDFLQKIGGRKFIMAMIATGVATFLELKAPNGLSSTMAAFLGSIVGLFSVANYAVTKQHMDSKSGGKVADNETSEKIDQLLEITSAANSPEAISNLTNLLQNITNGLTELKQATGQIALGVVNISKRQ